MRRNNQTEIYKKSPTIVQEISDESSGNESETGKSFHGRSSSPSSSYLEEEDVHPEWKLDTKCYVCLKSFTFKRRRHHCRRCGQSICSTHSVIRAIKAKVKTVRICEACDKKLLEDDYSTKYEEEVRRLREAIQKERGIKFTLASRKNEQENNTNEIRNEFENIRRENKRKEIDMELELKEIKIRNESLMQEYHDSREKLTKLHADQREAIEKLNKVQNEIWPLKEEIATLTVRSKEMTRQIEDLTYTMKDSMQVDKLKIVLCEPCGNIAQNFKKPTDIAEALSYLKANSGSVLSSKEGSRTPRFPRSDM